MEKMKELEIAAAHRFFSAECFNRAWDLIDRPNRSPEEDDEMLRLSMASTWHWSQRSDCTPTNLAVGFWQTARIFALLGQSENARRYARLSLEMCQKGEAAPFYFGYAYEALARAEKIARNFHEARIHISQARDYAAKILEPEDQKVLLADLDNLV